MAPPPPAAPKLDKNTVYWIEDPDKKSPPQVVADVEYRAGPRQLCFYDTQRPHSLEAAFTGGDAVTGYRFQAPGGARMVLRKLDRTAFEKVVRPFTSGAPPFKTDAELQKFYLGVIRSP
jgi:hypothetical protein